MQESFNEWSVQPSQAKKQLMHKFDSLTSPIAAAIQYAKEIGIEQNIGNSCWKTVYLIMEGLRLRGQDVPLEYIKIKENELQLSKLTGSLHPHIQQKLKNAKYFALGIFAQIPGVRIFKAAKAQVLEIVNKKYEVTKIEKAGGGGDHSILFHKPNLDKNIYHIYQSWQNQFSLAYWMQKSDQFQSISTQLFEEKIFPYEDPLQYLFKYFLRIKDFKMISREQCPRCSGCACICANQYQFIQDKQYLQLCLGIQTSPQSLQALKQITIQQFSWGKRLKYFNVLRQYMATEVE